MTQAGVYTRPDPFQTEQLQGVPDHDQDEAFPDRPPPSLSDLGEGLLEIIRASAVARGVALPGRQSVYMAPIPADCEQVAVLFTTWTPTPPPEGTMVCRNFRWMAPMSAIITRCTPAMPSGARKTVAPSPEAMLQAARLASQDAEVFLEVLNRLDEIGGDVSVVANAPSGGFQTVELNVQLLPSGSL